MTAIGVLFNELDMDDIVIVHEVLRALTAWEHMNKYYDGKYQIIQLTNLNNEIYVAHNLFNDTHVVNAYDFIQNIIEVLIEYCDNEENTKYMNEFWESRLKEILTIQNNL